MSYHVEFECSCGGKGHIRTTEDPTFCPICGHAEDIEIWESDFTIGEVPQPEVKVVFKDKIVYKTRPRRKGEDRRYGFRGVGATPTTGHRGLRADPNHKIVNDPPVISSVLNDDGNRMYSVDCGYTGLRGAISSHLEIWHGMNHKDAIKAVQVKNHDWQDGRHRLLVHDCKAQGLHPVSVHFLGYIKSVDGNRLYRYKIPECGFTGARTTLLRHLTIHHGYDLALAKLMSRVMGSNSLADRTHVNKFLVEDPQGSRAYV